MSALKNSRLFVLALVALLFILTTAASPAKLVPADIDPGTPPGDEIGQDLVCKTKCLISASVVVKPMMKGDTTTLLGAIQIVDENGKAVSGALVIAHWTLPDGTRVENRVTTDRNGFALVNIQAMRDGMYKLTVNRVVLAGYRFDRTKGEFSSEFAV